jgi:hypothetical protein
MRFNAVIVASCLLAIGAAVALAPVRQALGLALDDSWQHSVIHAELALVPLLYLPVRGGRREALSNLCAALACWAAGSAVVLLFSFASMHEVFATRTLSAAAWLAGAGLLALAARGDGWVARARVLLLCAFGLPPLWHYLALEYGGATATHLRPLSPGWSLASDDVTLWPLLLAGALCWVAALVIPARRTA